MNGTRSKLSYANVMSTIAVVAVLTSGVAVAHHAPNNTGKKALKKGAVTTKKLSNGAVGTKKLKNGAVNNAKLHRNSKARWAFVDPNGELLRGRGITAVELRPGFINHYLVTFDRSVGSCAYLATVSLAGGFATATDFDGTDVVNVVTRSETGEAASRNFFVQMVC